MDQPEIDRYEDPDRTGGQRFGDWCWDTIRTWVPAVLVVFLIRSALAEPFRIPSGSMVPTLAIGDHILVTKYSYGLRFPLTRVPVSEMEVPDRGDVIVFIYPPEDDPEAWSHFVDLPFPPFNTLDYVKRVVALPGETVAVRNNVLYINDVPQARNFESKVQFVNDRCREKSLRRYSEDLDGHLHSILTSTTTLTQLRDFPPTLVPEDHVFVMGDNRDHSSDSRVWGGVPLRNIKGKAQFVWLSYDQCEKGLPLLGDIRGERFGELVR